MKEPRQQWTIIFEDAGTPTDSPMKCRLKMVLKNAWRTHRLRCRGAIEKHTLDNVPMAGNNNDHERQTHDDEFTPRSPVKG